MSAQGQVAGAALHGVRTTPIDVHRDARGTFAEVFASHRDTGIDPAQWSVVMSEPGVLRGMHMHRHHDEYFALISGHVTVGLHDLRPESPTFDMGATFEFTDAQPLHLIFPRGVVHGWLFHRSSTHLQATSRAHDHYHPADNRGCHWSDPHLDVAWPFEPTVLAQRAEDFGTLEELKGAALSAS